MKNTIVLLSFCLCILSCNKPKEKSDFEATSEFYEMMIEKNDIAKLNQFFTNMPKGGDIHHHYTGSIYAETYLNWVKQKDWRIDSCSLKIITDKTKAETCKLLTVDEVIENTMLYRQLLELWSDLDFGNHNHSEQPPDLQFFNTFGYFGAVSDEYMDVGLNILKERAINENVSYIETMLSAVGVSSEDYFSVDNNFNALLRKAKTQQEVDNILKDIDSIYFNNKSFDEEIVEFVDKFTKDHNGIDTENFTMRFQSYGVRVLEPLQVYTDLLSAYVAATKSPLLVGVNIVAPENNHTALKDYTLHMQMFNYLKRKHPDVNRALHAGELTSGMVRPKNLLFHINQALDIAQAQRIGHGVDLPYEKDSYELLSKLKDQSAIEINLTSNKFILGVEGREHPYLIYSSFEVPLVISTDDSGVSRNNLSNEYMLLASTYKPSYEKIKEYVYNSIHYSFMNENDKKKSLNTLNEQFLEFEHKIAEQLRH
ncbi:amidohydrolase family protein [Psychroserpens luteolus]|uniref:adenosine deaminase n=1 Tax=Psychroserpens luteolus TaxID=2855840 RepID=UPI001E5ABDC7|nr:adenosine deaminase [Psychroserpens luteolus]MCD2259440.1 adenosine deaminase [Psychroserpens luteolus]